MKSIHRPLAFAVLAVASVSCAQNTEAFFKQHDKNDDGKLSREEFPQWAQRLFDQIDKDKDGFVTMTEDQAFRQSRQQQRRQQQRPKLPTPDHANVPYGTHERNVFDLWIAKSDKPTPLVIYYHGGGFRGGDKNTLNPMLLQQLLNAGLSVAAVNYRLSDVGPFPLQHHDCARALQFLRAHAAEYNLDPQRVGATGGSAGAGISLWLAFHDDLADPNSADPVGRESTRLTCAVVYAAQSSYDPRFIKKLFNTDQVDAALIPFFGMKEAADVDNPKFWPLFEEASALNHATPDDPPVMAFYPQPNQPLPPNSPGGKHIHHPKFGEVLKQKLDELGVECLVKFREDYPQPLPAKGGPIEDYVKFFVAKLLPKSK